MPMPRNADKAVRVDREHVVVVFTLRMSRAPQPELPESPSPVRRRRARLGLDRGRALTAALSLRAHRTDRRQTRGGHDQSDRVADHERIPSPAVSLRRRRRLRAAVGSRAFRRRSAPRRRDRRSRPCAATTGLVRFAADFMILKPREMQRGNRRVFYDYGNRGHKRALQFYNDAPHSNAPITPGARRQRLLHAPRLCGGVARLGGRHAAGRRPHGARRAGGERQRQADHRAHPRRIHRRCAGHHLLPAQRQDRGAFLCRRLARHARRGADAAALSLRRAAGDSARPVALRLRRVRRRRRDAVGGTRRGAVRAAHLPAGRLPARLDL